VNYKQAVLTKFTLNSELFKFVKLPTNFTFIKCFYSYNNIMSYHKTIFQSDYGIAEHYSCRKICKDKPLYNNIIRFRRRMSIMMIEQA